MFVSGSEIKKSFVKRGETVFAEGDDGNAAFIVETGGIGIFKSVEGEEIHLATMGEGELFGEMAVIDGSARMARARAVEDSVVIAIPNVVLERKISKYEPILRSLVQILVENLRNVHKIYMRRPRSTEDHINAIAYHCEGFRGYLAAMGGNSPAPEGLKQLDAVEAALAELRGIFDGHQDKRDNVLREQDVTRTFGGGGGHAQ